MPRKSDATYISEKDGEQLVTLEKLAISQGRSSRRNGDASALPWTGLALSGGGIRAATFALGAIQALTENGVFRHIDYISSVSGGGYTAASLHWWWSGARFREEASVSKVPNQYGIDSKTFPYGTEHLSGDPHDSKPQAKNLRYLRSHGYYLTPGRGLTSSALAAVVLRTVLLSFLIWMPLLVLLFTTLAAIDQSLSGVSDGRILDPVLNALFWPELKNVLVKISASCTSEFVCAFRYRTIYAVSLWLWLLSLLVFVAVTIAFGLASRAVGTSGSPYRAMKLVAFALVAILSVYLFFNALEYNDQLTKVAYAIFFIGSFLFSFIAVIFQGFPSYTANWSYGLRRALERLLGVAFLPSFLLFLGGVIPFLGYYLAQFVGQFQQDAKIAGLFGAISTISGAISAVYGYYSLLNKEKPGLAGKIFAPLGAGVYIYGSLLTSYFVSVFCFEALGPETGFFTNSATRTIVQILSVFVFVMSAFLLFTVNINFIGLHRFYRDRLMEAFMPSFVSVRDGQVKASYAADRLLLQDLTSWTENSLPGADEPTPYPIINSFANLADDKDKMIAVRGGENFILSPLYIGCRATGWLSTSRHSELFGPVTLASAMAASGAAINSNAGYIGTGVTRNRLVSLVMTTLNMRLGMWVGNPAHYRTAVQVPTVWNPVLRYGVFPTTQRRSKKFIEISDGGNFENLGVYELIRRKLGVIVVVDGEMDEKIGLPAFVSVVQRVREDFGATIEFVKGKGPERFIPGAMPSGSVAYPSGALFAKSPFSLADVTYCDGKQGVIVYVKSTLISDLAFSTLGYRAQFPDFPHQSTADQFFDPAQFEAYRELGYKSASVMCEALDLKSSINLPGKIRTNYAAL